MQDGSKYQSHEIVSNERHSSVATSQLRHEILRKIDLKPTQTSECFSTRLCLFAFRANGLNLTTPPPCPPPPPQSYIDDNSPPVLTVVPINLSVPHYSPIVVTMTLLYHSRNPCSQKKKKRKRERVRKPAFSPCGSQPARLLPNER